MRLSTPEPVLTLDLFEPLSQHLDELLRSLSSDDWTRATACPLWSVKDIVAHLLDTDLRRLSLHRDQHSPPAPTRSIDGYDSLVAWLNELNAQWVTASNRLSPTVLISLLEWTGPQVRELFAGLEPFETAKWPVAWAGESVSANWFDIAREYTEKWLHQQQIREATDRPLLDSPTFLGPVIDTFVRALPHAYRSAVAPKGSSVVVRVSGSAGGYWTLKYDIPELSETERWTLLVGDASQADASIVLSPDTAWRLFSRGLTRAQALTRVKLEGRQSLALVALDALAIMA